MMPASVSKSPAVGAKYPLLKFHPVGMPDGKEMPDHARNVVYELSQSQLQSDRFNLGTM
jgi:hypothetical protein